MWKLNNHVKKTETKYGLRGQSKNKTNQIINELNKYIVII